jgi:hypothetical protein
VDCAARARSAGGAVRPILSADAGIRAVPYVPPPGERRTSRLRTTSTVEHFSGQVPGGLGLVPLPWSLLMRVVKHLFNTRKFVEVNSRPKICRTMIVGLRLG